MASNRQKQQAWERWTQHCLDIQQVTCLIPKGSEAEQQERIARAKKDYQYFVKTYFPHLASKECGKFQIDAAGYLRDNTRARAAFEWARGHAKSSHISLMIPLWLMIQNNRQPMVMILVSKNQDAAKRLLSDLQAELETNDLYIHDFGQQKGNGLWTDGEFVTAKGDMFIALGRGQSPRGIKKRGVRVNYISIDDIDDDEMCRNPRRVNDAVDWCLTALMGTMEMGRGRFVIVGNRIGTKSVLAEIAGRPHFYHTVVNALNDKGRPTWKENYTLQEIIDLRIEMGERRFQKEYMNNPINEGTIFEKKYIRYGKMLRPRDYRAIVCYTDPSFKASAKNDYKATLLVGITPQGQYHVLKAYADQTTVSTMIGWHYDIHEWIGDTPVRYIMEANFMQDLLMDEFRAQGEKVGWQIPLIGDKRSKPEKFSRIENMQPHFHRGDVIFNEDERGAQGFEVLEEQLLLFERGSKVHDDAPDALEGAIWVLSNNVRKSNTKHRSGKRPSRKY
jgi:predicted phage terminase large subunit-like protein